jgi:hypothetical protein
MVIAEAVSIDGGVLLAVLVVFLVLLGLWLGLVALGCWFAKQAGEGSAPAPVGWALVAVAQTAPLTLGDAQWLLLALAILVVQATFYLVARGATESVDRR